VAEQLARPGFFSLLRWRSDATRDEAKNLAVIVVEERGRFGGVRHAPLSTISQSLRDQGIMDELLAGLDARFVDGPRVTLRQLTRLHETLHRALVVTAPQEVAVHDLDETLAALYRAYVAPRIRGSRAPTKGAVLDRVVDALRRQGVVARRGAYVDDFLFDVVIENGGQASVLEVLSFAAPRKDWAPIERDAGHFLYALQRLALNGTAVIQPPGDDSKALESWERVRRWMESEEVRTIEPNELTEPQQVLDLAHTT
jgi:hypothetical protein